MGRKLALIFLISLIFISTLSVIPKAEKAKAEENTYNTNDFAQAFPSDMPVVFVDPPNATADLGDTITISVKIFNLSNTVHLCDKSLPSPDIWSWGEPLPPYNPNGRYNYSLGNLYGLEVQFSWDPNILEYVNHTVKIPVETYPDGILHEAIFDVMDEVDAVGGTYILAKSTWGPGNAFNKPGDNATVFEITFNVVKMGRAYLNITSSDLAVPIVNPNYTNFFAAIPHWVKNGELQTSVLATRIQSLSVEPFDNATLFTLPVISGESAFVSTTIINDGSITDTYNLTLHWGPTLLDSWSNETLEPGEQKNYNYTIDEAELSIGNHTTTANISISHDKFIFTDKVVKQFRVIGTPQLEISGPDSATVGETVEFTSNSTHNDPDGVILNYTWALWGPGETHPRETIRGSVGVFNLHYKLPSGEWIVTLSVKDNYGVEHDEDRPATSPYRTEHLLFLNSIITPPPASPTLTISPSEAPMGSKISIFGEDFMPGMSLVLTFEDLFSFSSLISVITVGENGTFNATMILPVVNSGNYTIKAIGTYYFPYETFAATVSFRVTKGLDTLFEELEALREAINQTVEECQCCEKNQSATNGKIDSNEGSQTNIDTEPSDTEKLSPDEILDLAESMLFESRIYVLIAMIIAIVALLLSGIVIIKRS